MSAIFTTTATTTDGRTLTLDTPAPVGTGRVFVTVQPVPSEQPRRSSDELLADLRVRQAAEGHVPMSREEIDQQVDEERESWGDR